VPPASQWVVDGDVLNVAKSNETSLAVTPHALAPSLTFNGDTPYVTWAEINSKGVSLVHVRHKDGDQWVEDGGLLNISIIGHAASPTLASAKNNLYAAWSEADSKGVAQIYVKGWNGKEWVKTGDSLNINPANQALNPALTGNDSSLYVAWLEVDSAGISGLYVKEWDGKSWRLLGGASMSHKLTNDNENPPPLNPLPQGEGRYERLPIIPPPLTGGGEGEGEQRAFFG
jgi:hypothetical protein